MLVLEKIISGGQTGADLGGLRAARRLNLQTGGTAPHGWRTLAGPAPWLADYGLVEHASSNYQRRTEVNVRDSDATVRFARNFYSTGERCTFAAIRKYRKPCLDIDLNEYRAAAVDNLAAEAFLDWLVFAKIRVLNVAGNSETTAPGIGAVVEEFLVRALEKHLPRKGS